MNPLIELSKHGQSYWLDNLTRRKIESGDLERRVREQDLRGITSNPAIFNHAITGEQDYDPQIRELAEGGSGTAEIYERLVIRDIQDACDVLRPVYDRTSGGDGFVSLEVSPHLALDTQGSIAEARRLWAEVDRPNLLIKIPGTNAGVPAIEQLLYQGINVNITLLFSIEAYEAVADAYLRALERRAAEGATVRSIASVASFFLSRIDTLVDSRLEQIASSGEHGPLARHLAGKAAIANAKLAYQRLKNILADDRWTALEAHGAHVQRLLWASTSTKNPAYHDVMYVEPLIGPHTVNTMPDQTITAFAEHGRVLPDSVERDVGTARQTMEDIKRVGIDFRTVTDQLLEEGIEKFNKPYDELLKNLAAKRERLATAAARY